MNAIEKIWPQWHIEELIGQGQYGRVYKVKREDFGNVFYSAVKVIEIPGEKASIQELESTGMDADSIRKYFHSQVEGLMNEIKVMESLKSAKTILAIEDYTLEEHKGKIGWAIYIRMELLESVTKYMRRQPMSREEILNLGIDMCDALDKCEKSHVIHRDIKLDNIFRNQYGDFKLGDFGVAKQMEKTSHAATLTGTQTYMAPEILRMEAYDYRVDIYSLGLVLYRLLNKGQFPFVPRNPMPNDIQNAVERRLKGESLPNPCDADPRLSRVVIKACSFRKEERYGSAKEMEQALKECLNSSAGLGAEALKNTDTQVFSRSSRAFEGEYEDEGTYGWFGTTKEAGTEIGTKQEPEVRGQSETQPEPESEPKPVPERGEDVHVDQYLDEEVVKKGGKLRIEVNGKQMEADIPKDIKDETVICLENMGVNGKHGGADGNLLIHIHILDQAKKERIEENPVSAQEESPEYEKKCEEENHTQIYSGKSEKSSVVKWITIFYGVFFAIGIIMLPVTIRTVRRVYAELIIYHFVAGITVMSTCAHVGYIMTAGIGLRLSIIYKAKHREEKSQRISRWLIIATVLLFLMCMLVIYSDYFLYYHYSDLFRVLFQDYNKG